jgi:acyl-CoA hydrolase
MSFVSSGRKSPQEFLPVQAGVGNISDAILAEMGHTTVVPTFSMDTEILDAAST